MPRVASLEAAFTYDFVILVNEAPISETPKRHEFYKNITINLRRRNVTITRCTFTCMIVAPEQP